MTRNFTFRKKIFWASFLIGLLFLISVIGLNFYQNSKNFDALRIQNIEKINVHIKESLQYFSFKQKDIVLLEKIQELSNLHNVKISLFDIDGRLFVSSHNAPQEISHKALEQLKNKTIFIEEIPADIPNAMKVTSYAFLEHPLDSSKMLLAVQMVESDNAMFPKIAVLLKQNVLLIIILAMLCIGIAWWLSAKLTERISALSGKLLSTDVNHLRAPLEYDGEDEIKPLVTAYNEMLIKLEEQKKQLQKAEREEAWKEMARQMVHEINNPLTPLRLTVQNFYRRYRPEDSDNIEKVKELTKTILHQIDTISAIVKSFSDFSQMPLNADKEKDVVDIIRNTIAVFPKDEVFFSSNVEQLFYKIDGLYLTRIITNIVKNALQAIPNDRQKHVDIILTSEQKEFVISIADNGIGLSDEQKEKAFLPNFTTKEEGMGIGLSMVKKIVEDYDGEIWFETQLNLGTTFFIKFYKN